MNNCLECSLKTENPKFCSLSCSAKFQAKKRILKDKTKICLECGKFYKYNGSPNQKFCNHSCAAKNSNKKRKKEIVCINCNAELIKKNSTKYCSVQCGINFRKTKHIEKWLKDPSYGNSSQGLKQSIKKYLIEKAGNKCSKCGWNEINPITKRSPLEIDHIDGNCYNNHSDNLRVLCPNCHSLTETYKALNKNSKRNYRRN